MARNSTSIIAQSSNCMFATEDRPEPCPRADFAFCASDTGPIILRCRTQGGCPQPGNCAAKYARLQPFLLTVADSKHYSLAPIPPVGSKVGAQCWEDSPTAGNAQCTVDCVSVTALNGSVIFPEGCSSALADTVAGASFISSNISASATGSAAASSSSSQGTGLQIRPQSSMGALGLILGVTFGLI
jgi:hypothetical protein